MRKLLILSGLFLLSFCAYSGIYRHDVPAEQYKTLAAQPQFDCVGEVFEEYSGEPHGSCVLIGKKYVLTAAHLFWKSENAVDTEYTMEGGAKITIYKQVNGRFGSGDEYTFRFNRKRYEGKKLIIFPAYTDSQTSKSCDLAIVELDEPVEDVVPAVLSNTFDELHKMATGVGFGVSGRADKPEEVDIYMEKIAGQNMIDTLKGYLWEGKPTILAADFDHPTNKECSQLGDVHPMELEYTTGGGDSGGPLFIQTPDGWKVIGICSGGGVFMDNFLKYGYYSQPSEWTRVSVFYDWILKNMNDVKTVAK